MGCIPNKTVRERLWYLGPHVTAILTFLLTAKIMDRIVFRLKYKQGVEHNTGSWSSPHCFYYIAHLAPLMDLFICVCALDCCTRIQLWKAQSCHRGLFPCGSSWYLLISLSFLHDPPLCSPTLPNKLYDLPASWAPMLAQTANSYWTHLNTESKTSRTSGGENEIKWKNMERKWQLTCTCCKTHERER